MESIKDKVAIVGMGCTKFGELWDQSPEDLTVDGDLTVNENLIIGADLTVNGNLMVVKDLTVGNMTITEDMTINDYLSVSGDAMIEGDSIVSGDMTIDGNTNRPGACTSSVRSIVSPLVIFIALFFFCTI